MGEPHVISALTRKRATISGELLKAEKRCEAMRLHLAALDTSLRLMGYEGDPEDIKPVHRKRRLFRRGELQRAIMDVLRAAEGPLSDADLVDRVMAAKALDAENVDLRRTITERVKAVRKRFRDSEASRR
ncbi:MAG: hypothetical protein IIC03_00610 [Proteobacteria bacterium]|nr:hypothetical protein [Pseudomonadota bacterium]